MAKLVALCFVHLRFGPFWSFLSCTRKACMAGDGSNMPNQGVLHKVRYMSQIKKPPILFIITIWILYQRVVIQSSPSPPPKWPCFLMSVFIACHSCALTRSAVCMRPQWPISPLYRLVSPPDLITRSAYLTARYHHQIGLSHRQIGYLITRSAYKNQEKSPELVNNFNICQKP